MPACGAGPRDIRLGVFYGLRRSDGLSRDSRAPALAEGSEAWERLGAPLHGRPQGGLRSLGREAARSRALKAPLAGERCPSLSQPAGHKEVVSLWPNGVSPTVKLMQLFSGTGTAGRSAEAKYKALASAWRRRLLGRRAPMYFWGVFAVALIAVVSAHPSGRWGLYAGFVFGGAAVAWILLPDAVMPHQVFKWQLGAWGEQKTASELRRLERDGWLIRHDVAWGERSNHDHVVAGPAVYVVNSKTCPPDTSASLARQSAFAPSTIRATATSPTVGCRRRCGKHARSNRRRAVSSASPSPSIQSSWSGETSRRGRRTSARCRLSAGLSSLSGCAPVHTTC